jgi:DNA polymerase (family 10)
MHQPTVSATRAARGDAGDPPADLLELEHIRGDLHVHTTASDGKATVERWAEPRWSSVTSTWRSAITHATFVSFPGLDADDIRRQGEEIAAANEALAPFRVLRGSECDILPDGSLGPPR